MRSSSVSVRLCGWGDVPLTAGLDLDQDLPAKSCNCSRVLKGAQMCKANFTIVAAHHKHSQNNSQRTGHLSWATGALRWHSTHLAPNWVTPPPMEWWQVGDVQAEAFGTTMQKVNKNTCCTLIRSGESPFSRRMSG